MIKQHQAVVLSPHPSKWNIRYPCYHPNWLFSFWTPFCIWLKKCCAHEEMVKPLQVSQFHLNRRKLSHGSVWIECPVEIFGRSKIRSAPCECSLTLLTDRDRPITADQDATQVLQPIDITGKLTNQFIQTGLRTFDWQQLFTWLWWWLPLRLSKRQSPLPTTVHLRTTLTRTIKLHYNMLSPGSNHLL